MPQGQILFFKVITKAWDGRPRDTSQGSEEVGSPRVLKRILWSSWSLSWSGRPGLPQAYLGDGADGLGTAFPEHQPLVYV